METVDSSQPAAEVLLGLEGPRPQRRLSVGFRLLLAIPHFLYFYVLSVVMLFALIAGWFAALVTGRLPGGIRLFVGRILRYATRLYAYSYFLLTDRYPPFSLDDDDYPVQLLLPPPTRLNRAAVLFRGILYIPAGIAAVVALAGATVVAPVVWVIVLAKGRLPDSIFQAYAAVLRYVARLYAYVAMLTPEYPRGLYGDKPSGAAPGDAPLSFDDEAGGEAVVTPPPSAPTTAPLVTRLVLSKAARRLVILFLVLGATTYGGSVAVGAIGGVRTGQASVKLQRADKDFEASIQSYSRDVQSCGVSGGIDCVHRANKGLRDSAVTFQDDLRKISFPGNAVGPAHQVDQDMGELIGLLDEMGSTTDVARYQDLATQFQTAGDAFDADYKDLTAVLGIYRR